MWSGLLAALAILLGGTYGTTACDQRFLDVLHSHGIAFLSPEWAIWDAHEVCVNLENGVAPETIAENVEQQSGMDGWHSGFFVGASIAAYCPQWARLIGGQA